MADEDVSVAEERAALRDYRRLTRLYCVNGGHHLQILPDGTVRGQRDGGDVHGEAAAHCAFLSSRSRVQVPGPGPGPAA